MKASWFKFDVGDWMMGRIQRENDSVQIAFIRLMCKYWHNECDLTIEEAELEAGGDELGQLIKRKLVKTYDDNISIQFLDEQWESVTKISDKRSEVAKQRWNPNAKQKKAKADQLDQKDMQLHTNANQLHENTMQLHTNAMQGYADKIREDKIRKDKSIHAPAISFQKVEVYPYLSDRFKSTWETWKKFVHEHHNKTIGGEGERMILRRLGDYGNEQTAINAIEFCLEKMWANINFELLPKDIASYGKRENNGYKIGAKRRIHQ